MKRNFESEIRRAERALQSYNRKYRRVPYLHPHAPLKNQHYYTVFLEWVHLLHSLRLAPERFLALLPKQERELRPQMLLSEWAKSFASRHKKLKVAVEEHDDLLTGKPFADDYALLEEMVKTSGKDPIYIMNIVWGLLSPAFRKFYSSFRCLKILELES